jgi:hypothetical protein
VVPGPRAGRAPRVEDRRGSVRGPESAAAASTPRPGRRNRSPGLGNAERTGGSAEHSSARSRSSTASSTAGTP